jgi:hypothetical protein
MLFGQTSENRNNCCKLSTRTNILFRPAGLTIVAHRQKIEYIAPFLPSFLPPGFSQSQHIFWVLESTRSLQLAQSSFVVARRPWQQDFFQTTRATATHCIRQVEPYLLLLLLATFLSTLHVFQFPVTSIKKTSLHFV